MERTGSPAHRQLLQLYMQVARRFGETMHELSLHHELTPMQAMALGTIGEQTLPTKEIARHLRCDPSNATGLIDQLERRGLVRRFTPPDDRRVRAVQATEAGLSVQREMHSAMGSAESVLDRLDDTDVAELHRILTILDTDGAAGS